MIQITLKNGRIVNMSESLQLAYDFPGVEKLTKSERTEIANYMMERWAAWGENREPEL